MFVRSASMPLQELALLLAVAGVDHRRQAEVDEPRPVGVPERIVDRRQVAPMEVARHVRAGESVRGDPVELGEDGVEVGLAGRVTDAQDAIARGAELVGRPPVVRAHPGGHDVLGERAELRAQGAERAWVARVHELGRDALPIHLGHADLAVPAAEVAARRPRCPRCR